MQGETPRMIGQRLGNRYDVVRELGRGGMGVVYLARDSLLEREVAIKVISESELSPDFRERFMREARVIAKMDHPGIVSVHDIGEQGGALFLVMAFIPGANLRELLDRNGPLSVPELVDLGVQASDALEHAHSLGIVHRDVKPENIMVVRRGGGGTRVLLADFGLATALSEQRLTRPGAVMGTVAYMSPEQVAARAVDGRADVYALGTVLYECAAGAVPFPGGEIASMLYRIAHQPAPALRSVAPHVDPELEAIVMRCLQKDPALRPQRPRDLAEALQVYRSRHGPTEVAISVPDPRSGVPSRLQPTVVLPSGEAPPVSSPGAASGSPRLWIATGTGLAVAAAVGGVALLVRTNAVRRALHGPLDGGNAFVASAATPPAGGPPAPAPVTPGTSSASNAPATCDRYCDQVMKNCTGSNAEYLSREICMKMCPAFEIGVAGGDTANGTLGCRLYQANAAESAPEEHCRAAGPLGGRHCGKDPCEPFCTLAVTYCTAPKPAPYAGGLADCEAACKNYRYLVGDAGDTTLESGNTLNCRLWHLETAYTSDDFGMFHCPHTKRVSSTCH
jgi:serine/threonine protein kinase